VRPGGLILAHNTTNMESGMQDYVEAVTTNPDLETKFIHTHDQGVGVTLKKRTLVSDERIDKQLGKDREPDVLVVDIPLGRKATPRTDRRK